MAVKNALNSLRFHLFPFVLLINFLLIKSRAMKIKNASTQISFYIFFISLLFKRYFMLHFVLMKWYLHKWVTKTRQRAEWRNKSEIVWREIRDESDRQLGIKSVNERQTNIKWTFLVATKEMISLFLYIFNPLGTMRMDHKNVFV